jgi:DNA-binding SARP family transcriptional activator
VSHPESDFSLRLLLLGSPQLERDGRLVEIDRRKALALFAYLATTKQVHSREALATLLWPDYSQDRAYANLRLTLWSLNKVLGKTWLDISSDSIGLGQEDDLWLDVDAFHNYLSECQKHGHEQHEVCSACVGPLSTAVELYRDDFLSGFTLRDSPAFDDWQFFQAESLRRELGGALEKLARCHVSRGDFEQAINYARRWLALDPIHEPAHRELMWLYYWASQRSAALRQYNQCVATLKHELGIDPEPETRALYQAIREKRVPTQFSNQATPELGLATVPSTSEGRNRHQMLKNVRIFWIEGVLENSLHGAALLELGMQQEVEMVDHPWASLLRTPGLSDRTLPPGTSALDVFDKLNGKLLILGDPGGGKTTTLLELARDLLTRAERDALHPIPVVLNLVSWSKDQGTIAGWLVNELGRRYQVAPEVAEEWVEGNALLLLLDGLDEVSLDQREACIQAINTYRQAHGFVDMVVCSRSAEYEVLARKLKLNGAVALLPLTDTQIDDYLASLGQDVAMVRALLTADANLRVLCRSPLMLSIMVLAYRDTSAQDMLGFDTSEEQRRHLFDVYVARMFQRRPGDKPYSPQKTILVLAWLARHMLEERLAIFQVEDLRSKWLEVREEQRHYRLRVALVLGLLDGLTIGAVIGLPLAVFRGLGTGMATGLAALVIWELASWLAAKLGAGLSVGAWTSGLAVLLGALLMAILPFHPSAALLMGLIVALIASFTPGDEVRAAEERTSTQQGIGSAVRRARGIGLVSGIIGGLIAGLAAGWIHGLLAGVISGLIVGIVVGLIAATVSRDSRAVIRHYVLRSILYHYQQLPKDFARLLDYSVRLILLRQVGDGYIFVHRYLMEYFAGLENPHQQT